MDETNTKHVMALCQVPCTCGLYLLESYFMRCLCHEISCTVTVRLDGTASGHCQSWPTYVPHDWIDAASHHLIGGGKKERKKNQNIKWKEKECHNYGDPNGRSYWLSPPPPIQFPSSLARSTYSFSGVVKKKKLKMLQFQWMDWRWIGEDGRYCYYNYTKPNQTKPSTTRHLSKLWLGWLHPSALQSMLLSIVRNRLGQHLLCLLLQIAISQYLSLYSHPLPFPSLRLLHWPIPCVPLSTPSSTIYIYIWVGS